MSSRIEIKGARIPCIKWFHSSQPMEIPYVSSQLVKKITIPNAPSEYKISEMGCLMQSGKESFNREYVFTRGFQSIASKDVMLLFKRPINVEEPLTIIEELENERIQTRILPPLSCVCKINLEGPVLLIDIPNGSSEFNLMIYEKIIPVFSKNGILIIKDILPHLPEAWKNLQSYWDGKLPERDKENTFNFSTILQVSVVFNKPIIKQPFARIVYYDLQKTNGDSIIPCYITNTSRRRPTKKSLRYEINDKGRIIRDLKTY